MPQGNPLPGERYLHFKNRLYQVITVAVHSETMERYVVYQALYGDYRTYVRPYDMFVSEVDHGKYPQVEQKYRFAYQGCVFAKGEFLETGRKEPAQTSETGRLPEPDGAAMQKERDVAPDEAVPDPWLTRFLDAEDLEGKYQVLCEMRPAVTDRLINDMAVAMDVSIPEGRLEQRYAQLKNCIRTRQKYEGGRLR